MNPNYDITPKQLDMIMGLYKDGNSAQEIKDLLQLPHTTRSIQRRVKKAGLSRSVKESFILAVKKGRVTYHTNPNKVKRLKLAVKLRYEVLQRDNYRCRLCGNTAQNSRLQIDHIDENKNNNNPSNLQVLCEECNKGKYWNSIKPQA